MAEKKAKELEDLDRAVYDERQYYLPYVSRLPPIVYVLTIIGDLAGIKVGHGADDFEAGEDVILTLKDSKVLGEDGTCLDLLASLAFEKRARN